MNQKYFKYSIINNIKLKMKKKKYEKPSWGVIEMRQQLQLLQVSGGLDQPDSYPGSGSPFS